MRGRERITMMHPCAYCGTTVIVGGTKAGGRRYCNTKCAESGARQMTAVAIPTEVVERAVSDVRDGDCPVCSGPGPVDVFTSHRVLSVIAFTSWKSIPRISCRRCGTKAQLGNTAYSLVLGWWGIPWGFVMTPVQIGRNLFGLTRDASSGRPSPLFEAIVREQLAEQAQAADATQRAA
jgi:hypothetical protein